MIKSYGIILALFVVVSWGCATQKYQFYDSASNDHNVAPKSLNIPKHFVQDGSVVDTAHNQAEADYLFLKSDLQTQAGLSTESIDSLKAALIYDPNSATLMQRLAVEYYKKNQLQQSMEYAERAMAIAPESREINLLIGGLYTTTKMYEKAEKIYLTLLKKDKDDDEAMLYLGAVYSEMKNYIKSMQSFRFLAKKTDYASRHMAHYYLARVMLEQNQKTAVEQAQKELTASLKIKPDFYESISLLGQLIQKKSGLVLAYKFYEAHQKKYGPIAKLAEILSQYYIEKNQYDKAYEQLEIIDASADDLVQVKLKMALILIDKKMFEPAEVKLKEILAFAPESDKVRFYLSAVYEEKKDFENAIVEYSKITKDSSFFQEARLHAAYLSRLLGRTDKAITLLQESVAIKSESSQNYFLLAQLFEDQQEFTKAVDVLNKAKKIFPQNPQVYFYLGSIQDKMNQKEQMIVSMQKVLELDRDHVQAMNYLAFSWAEMNLELDKAEKLARTAVIKEKNDAFILDTLGWVLYKKGNFSEAKNVLEKAYSMQPAVGIIAEHLGDAYIKLNQFDKARELFIKASESETNETRKTDLNSKISQAEIALKDYSRRPASTTTLPANRLESP